ncbi:hypothetical protein FJZ26_01410 [Candidatus Parvarchaeota archaeon]|nr:hypothetical protein [Candidatus Parvarchaeota archaeon]
MRISLLFIASIFFLATANMPRAQPSCTTTSQCAEGFCINSTCTVPQFGNYSVSGLCSKTTDCSRGFCLNFTCIVPAPAKASAAAGFGACKGFLNTLTGGKGLFCDLWFHVLVMLSAIAAALARKIKFPFASIAAFFVPVLAGYLAEAAIGLGVAFISIVYLMAISPGRQSQQGGNGNFASQQWQKPTGNDGFRLPDSQDGSDFGQKEE